MPARGKPAISAQINRHAKAAFGLKLINLLSAIRKVPDIDSSIIGSTGEILAIRTHRNSPGLSSLVIIDNLPFLSPLSRFRKGPRYCFTAEPDGCCMTPVA